MLEAALRSLASGDPGSVSANRIAKDIGATWGAVQYQFGDADGFWAAVLHRTAERRADVFSTVDSDAPLRDRVAGARDAFSERESEERRRAAMPPFGRLAGVIVSAETRETAFAHARAMAAVAPHDADVAVLGPAEAPIAVVRGRHRFRLLMRTDRTTDIQAALRDWLARCPAPRGDLRVQVDVDPQSFL